MSKLLSVTTGLVYVVSVSRIIQVEPALVTQIVYVDYVRVRVRPQVLVCLAAYTSTSIGHSAILPAPSIRLASCPSHLPTSRIQGIAVVFENVEAGMDVRGHNDGGGGEDGGGLHTDSAMV